MTTSWRTNPTRFLRELCQYHVSGQLKVAPEHVSPKVLAVMGKPGRDVYDAFCEKYKRINQELGKEQYLVPYLISSHPGSDLSAAIELAEYLRDINHQPEQVQDLSPHAGHACPPACSTPALDPRSGKPVYIPRSPEEKAMQRALLQFRRPQNFDLGAQGSAPGTPRGSDRHEAASASSRRKASKTAHEYAQIRRERKATRRAPRDCAKAAHPKSSARSRHPSRREKQDCEIRLRQR